MTLNSSFAFVLAAETLSRVRDVTWFVLTVQVFCGSRWLNFLSFSSTERTEMVVLRSKAGFSPDLESTRMWDASLENAKQPPCDIRSIWLQVPSFPRARPRMCRREDWVAALSLIEAHSHTLSSFRRIKLSQNLYRKFVCFNTNFLAILDRSYQTYLGL